MEGESVKIVFLGDSCSGKSVLIYRYVEGYFTVLNPTTEAIPRGETLDYHDQKVKLHIWDTVGQEEYQSLIPMYTRNCDGIVITYSVHAENFQQQIVFWLAFAREWGDPKAMIAIAETKNDLEKYRKVEKGEGEEYAQWLGLNFWSTSAKTGEGVEELFTEFAHQILDKKNGRSTPDIMRVPIPVVGADSSGKSALIERFLNGVFNENPAAGAFVKIKTLEYHGEKVALKIWDTARQERLDRPLAWYISKCAGIIITYSVQAEDFFEEIDSWLALIRKEAPNAMIGMVETKTDLMEGRVVEKGEGEAYAQMLGIKFWSTSAKTGEGVHKLFTEFAHLILDKEHPSSETSELVLPFEKYVLNINDH